MRGGDMARIFTMPERPHVARGDQQARILRSPWPGTSRPQEPSVELDWWERHKRRKALMLRRFGFEFSIDHCCPNFLYRPRYDHPDDCICQRYRSFCDILTAHACMWKRDSTSACYGDDIFLTSEP